MASKDVEMTGKDNPNNSMNDKRDYEVEECVSLHSHQSLLLIIRARKTCSALPSST